MAEVARVVIRGLFLGENLSWGCPADFVQPFVDVANLGVPLFRELVPFGIGGEEGRETSEMGSAAAGI